MARPERNDVDYFPFYCKEGKAMYIVESQFGNDGYASWVKILRLLAVTNYHYLNLSTETEVLFVASKCKVDKETLLKIINTLVKIGEFDAEFWEQHIIWSEKFTSSIKDAYFKRGNKLMEKPEFMTFLEGLGVLKPGKGNRKPTEKRREDYTILNESTYRAFAHLKISKEDFEKLITEGFTKEEIDHILNKVENYKKNKQYTSLYLTALNWLKKDKKDAQKIITAMSSKVAGADEIGKAVDKKILDKLNGSLQS